MVAQKAHNMTPVELGRSVEAYFAECAAQEVFPDRAGMILYLGLPTEVYLRYEAGTDKKYAEFTEVLRKARYMREGWLSRVMFSDKNKVQSAMFHLRQPSNGGYSERQETQGAANIRLSLGEGGSDLAE